MRSTSGPDRTFRFHRRKSGVAAFAATLLVGAAGCSEFSHFGQISNRQTSAPVNDVRIEQRQPDGRWKSIGRTDGKGAWNIFKHEIHGSGLIRLSKPGFAPMVMEESDFLSQNVILLQPAGDHGIGDDGVDDPFAP